MKIRILKDCDAPKEKLLHPGEGCDCSVKVPTPLFEGEEFDQCEIDKMDLSGLKYKEHYEITEYP